MLNNVLHPPNFSGWGMTTQHTSPWEDAYDWAHFRDALEVVREQFEHGLVDDTGVSSATVDTLAWRHWFVSFSVRYACQFTTRDDTTLVECGVGDGLTALFACTEASRCGKGYTLHCYDVWGRVKVDDGVRDYSALSLERTRRNLARFDDHVRYHVGLIPDSFDADAPSVVNYLSIDLNAAAPTLATLDFFLPRLAPRAVVLFDDYGYKGYESTKTAVDEYFSHHPGLLLKLPTGQAAWFN